MFGVTQVVLCMKYGMTHRCFASAHTWSDRPASLADSTVATNSALSAAAAALLCSASAAARRRCAFARRSLVAALASAAVAAAAFALAICACKGRVRISQSAHWVHCCTMSHGPCGIGSRVTALVEGSVPAEAECVSVCVFTVAPCVVGTRVAALVDGSMPPKEECVLVCTLVTLRQPRRTRICCHPRCQCHLSHVTAQFYPGNYPFIIPFSAYSCSAGGCHNTCLEALQYRGSAPAGHPRFYPASSWSCSIAAGAAWRYVQTRQPCDQTRWTERQRARWSFPERPTPACTWAVECRY